ncbi:MAG: 2-oxo acid dehydrogenase subunit E2 [Acutalibacteraceae bacterium]
MKITRREHFGIQRKMVSHMTTESWRTIPHVTYMYEPDVTELFKVYKEINKDRTPETKVTFNTVMLKIITEGLKACPILNSHMEFNRKFVTGKIDSFEDINISMPTILPNGEMMTINLRNFGNRSIENMTAYIKDVRRRAEKTNLTEAMYTVSLDNTLNTLKEGHFLRVIMKLVGANFGSCKIHHLHGKAKKEYEKIPETERLTIKDLEPGTVVVSNIGSTYLNQNGALSLLEIVPPMVSAFAIGAIQDKPVVVEKDGQKEIAVRSILPMCIAFDHRVIDFGDVVPFIKRLDEIFANPQVVFDWVHNDVVSAESGKVTTSYGVVRG